MKLIKHKIFILNSLVSAGNIDEAYEKVCEIKRELEIMKQTDPDREHRENVKRILGT